MVALIISDSVYVHFTMMQRQLKRSVQGSPRVGGNVSSLLLVKLRPYSAILKIQHQF